MEKELVYEVTCMKCTTTYVFDVSTKQDEELDEGKKKIQDIFPELSPDERELFLSGICGTCYDKMFAEG